MKLPELPTKRGCATQQMVSFGGLDWREGAADGTLSGCTNLSSALWPALSQRGGRTVQGVYDAPTAIYAREKLCVVDGTKLLYGGEQVGTVTPGEKKMAVVNTKLCIFPDKKYLDLETKRVVELEAAVSLPPMARFTDRTLQIDPRPVLVDGIASRYGIYDVQDITVKLRYYDTAPEWVDGRWVQKEIREARGTEIASIAQQHQVVGKYIIPSIDSDGRYDIPMTFSNGSFKPENWKGVYGIITAATARRGKGTFDGRQEAITNWSVEANLYQGERTVGALNLLLKVGDGVTVSGATAYPKNNKVAVIREITPDTIRFDGNLFAKGTETAALTVTRKVPDLEYICEVDNRLWGCAGTTIYASALGDPTNFEVYDGLSTDGYALAVGTEGPFTGCIGYSSGALFFKERCVHKLMGTSPKNYQMNTQHIHGVQEGSHRALCIVNEVLYYKGVDGVYAYSGGVPRLISDQLGTRRFFDASGGSDGRRYYLSMRGDDGAWQLLVFDLASGLWLQEDSMRVPDFAMVEGKLLMLSGQTVYIAESGDFSDGWSAVVNALDEGTMGRKCYVRLTLRLELAAGAWVKVETRTDGGLWRQVWLSPQRKNRVFAIPLRPARCDRLEIRLSGQGRCIVRGMNRSATIGAQGE